MRAVIFTLIFVPVALIAQQQPQSQSPLAGLFPEQQGPVANYIGYAFAECSASNTPAVRIVALQGLVPEGIPKTSPRPSIELVLNGPVDPVMGKPVTIVPKSAAAQDNAMALSCPVVGDCAAAESGAMTVTGRTASGSLTGEFRAKWAIGAPRAGKFIVSWRESQAKCG
jgi:hypothetical protein